MLAKFTFASDTPGARFKFFSMRLAQAAQVIATEPVTITLRYLQTLTEIANEKNSTIVFPLPIELLNMLPGRK